MNENFGLRGHVAWKVFDADGNLKEEGETPNRIFEDLQEAVIDAIDTGSMTAIQAMGIGTGSGQDVSQTAMSSAVSYENSSGSHWSESQPSAAQFQAIATFTATGSWTITEALLSGNATATADAYAYDDSLNVGLSASDTLQITWTLQTYS